ncbi:hypothetical protein [Amycolatopsis sp. NPDC054798]
MTHSTQGRRRIAPAALALAVLVPLATGCASRFTDLHQSGTGPVTEQAASLAKKHRLGPTGFGKLTLGMPLAKAIATGQIRENRDSGTVGCAMGHETGTTHDVVWISDTIGVAKIEAYEGVLTPEGIGLGASLDEVKNAYPGVKVETEADMGSGQIKMDDHYRAPVTGNPDAAYRIFVDRDDRVDSLLLVTTKPKPECEIGYSN